MARANESGCRYVGIACCCSSEKVRMSLVKGASLELKHSRRKIDAVLNLLLLKIFGSVTVRNQQVINSRLGNMVVIVLHSPLVPFCLCV